tara:strand:+ start:14773 stop:15306 length:534 start_codon:yes stop_codon:yes gene_type:complete
MGVLREPKPVKLFSGLIFKEKEILLSAREKLVKIFGEMDFESEICPFDYTGYYEQEMGKDLKRKFISFSKLIPPNSLPDTKNKTNEIEKELSHEDTGDRTVNIDPGYLSEENVVLATTKGYSHRPYLNSGIYAEMTYYFKRESYRVFDWTYPDFRLPERIEMFHHLRNIYTSQLPHY